jgi:hypothetical protein
MQRRDLSAQTAACAQDLTSRANAAVAAANARIAAVVAAAKSELVVLVPVCQVQANNRCCVAEDKRTQHAQYNVPHAPIPHNATCGGTTDSMRRAAWIGTECNHARESSRMQPR